MMWVWVADRLSGGASYVSLAAAALSGVPYDHERMGWAHAAARRLHVPISWAAVAVLLAHAAFGTVDVALVASGEAPAPGYGIRFLVAAAGVGIGALVLTVIATLAFVDPRRFERPWKPRL